MPFSGLHPLALAWLVAQGGATAREHPRDIALAAAAAVEGDSAAPVRRRWSARVARTASDWGAALGLASLARLTYDYPAADSIYAALSRSSDQGAAAYVAAAELGAGVGFHVRGFNARADTALGRAVAAARGAGDPLLEAEALLRLAGVRARTEGAAAAESLVAGAARLIPTGDLLLLSQYECSRAALLQMTGRAGDEAAARRGVDLARRAGNERQRLGCLRMLATFLIDRGRSDTGLTMFRDVVDGLTRIRDRATLASVLQWRGYHYNTTFRYGQARTDLLRAVEEGKASGAQSPVAWAMLSLAQLSAWADDLVSARAWADSADALFQIQADQWGLSTLRGMQGQMAYLAGDRVAARARFEQALAEAEALGYAPPVVQFQTALATLEMDEGRADAADRLLLAARRLTRERRLSAWERGLSYSFARLAVVRGRLAEAERLLREGQPGLDTDQPAAAFEWAARLADVLVRRGRIGEAEAELRRASDLLDSVRAALPDRELRRVVLQNLRDIHDPDLGIPGVLAAMAGAGRSEAAFELAERRKARTLLEHVVIRDALRHRGDAGDRTVDSLRRLSRGVTAGEVVAALPDAQTALLEFVTGTDGSPTTAFVLTRAGAAAVRLPPLDSLEPDIRRWTTLLEAGEDPGGLSRRLGTALLGPIVPLLPPGVSRLVIVPDLGLHRVPFDALALDGSGVVARRFAVSLAPSAGVAVQLWRRAANDRPVGLLAFGDPQFEGEAQPSGEAVVYRSAFAANGGLTRLAASGREVRALRRFAEASVIRLRRDASEAYLKRAPLGEYRIIHFAAHALVDEQAPTRTALALAPGEGEDGFVTPGDLAVLDLDADLVVLSACRTAGGAFVRGEGVEGLTSPLLQAGARSVIASLWRVGDRAAADFVGSFYAEMARGKAAGEALAAAKVAAHARGVPPGTWAAFTLVGNPAVSIPLRPPGDRRWAWALGGLAALMLVYGLVIRSLRIADRRRSPVVSRASTHQR